MFKRNIIQLAAKLNKWQIRYFKKQREHALAQAEKRKKRTQSLFPAPEAAWMDKKSWKSIVKKVKLQQLAEAKAQA